MPARLEPTPPSLTRQFYRRQSGSQAAGARALRFVLFLVVIALAWSGWYLAKRGFAYEDLRALNPRLIYTSVTPFGQWGPHSQYLGDDIVAGAMGGLMFLCGMPESPPSQPGGAIGSLSVMQADVIAAVGTLVGLVARDRTGRGQHIDVSMQEAVAFACENALGFYAVANTIRRRTRWVGRSF